MRVIGHAVTTCPECKLSTYCEDCQVCSHPACEAVHCLDCGGLYQKQGEPVGPSPHACPN